MGLALTVVAVVDDEGGYAILGRTGHMRDRTVVSAGRPHLDVAAILRAATLGLGLQVCGHVELRGASVVGPRAEAYVLPAATGTRGWQVDLWRPGGRDPYRIVRVPLLAEAVRFAVGEVLDAPGRRAWLSQWPG